MFFEKKKKLIEFAGAELEFTQFDFYEKLKAIELLQRIGESIKKNQEEGTMTADVDLFKEVGSLIATSLGRTEEETGVMLSSGSMVDCFILFNDIVRIGMPDDEDKKK
jgi:hypothetical protein